MPTTLRLPLPVAVSQEDIEVRVTTFERPSAQLLAVAAAAGFRAGSSPDHLVGPGRGLTALSSAMVDVGVPFVDIPHRQQSEKVVGDVLVYARMFAPDAMSAVLARPVLLAPKTEVTYLNGLWVAWGQAVIQTI